MTHPLLLHLYKSRKTLISLTLLFALVGFLFAIQKPLLYEAHGSFQDSSHEEAGSKSPLAEFLDPRSSHTFQILSTFRSHALLSELVATMHLQGELYEKKPSLFEKALTNILLEGDHLLNREQFSRERPPLPLTISALSYSGKRTVPLEILFTSGDRFAVTSHGKAIGEGTLGEPFQREQFSFTLEGRGSLKSRHFFLNLRPFEVTTLKLGGKLKVEIDDEDTSLITLTIQESDEQLAKEILNQLMTSYLRRITEQTDREIQMQLAYLERRQKELMDKQETLIDAHVTLIEEGALESGLIDPEKEMTFLFSERTAAKSKLHELQLRIAKLEAGIPLKGEELIEEPLRELTLLKLEKSRLAQLLGEKNFPVDDTLLIGFDLEAVKEMQRELFNDHRSLSKAVAEEEFILEKLADPNLEVASLSPLMENHLGTGLLKRTSDLSLLLHDEKNHTLKERERVRDELELERRFLTEHFTQNSSLLKFQTSLLSGKLGTIQRLLLKRIDERILLIEEQLKERSESLVERLKSEQALLDLELNRLAQAMATLPKQWKFHEKLKQSVAMQRTMSEEVTRLVESKNISHHLKSQGALPLDFGWTKPLPKRPHLLLFTLLGGSFGALLGAAFLSISFTQKRML